jgi:hypothetical protein
VARELIKILSLFKYLDGSQSLSYNQLQESLKALDFSIQQSTEIWGLFNDAKKCYYLIDGKASKAKSEFARTLMYFLNYLDSLNETLDSESSDTLKSNVNGARYQLNLSLSELLKEKLSEESSYGEDSSEVYLLLSNSPTISDPLTYPKF